MTTVKELAARESGILAAQGRYWTDDQTALIKRTICRGATDDEFALFSYVCERTRLDPFLRQIHAVKRWSAAEGREVMAIQVGIGGFHLIADRTGAYCGNDEPRYGPPNKNGHPESATVTVWKLVAGQRCAFTATVRWDEFKQLKRDGGLTAMWARMPFLMLGKCAEAAALRKGFPAELSGLQTPDEEGAAEAVAGGGEEPKSPLDNPLNNIWRGTLVRVESREFQRDGKPALAHKLVATDGEFGTWFQDHADRAQKAIAAGHEVEILFELGVKGARMVVALKEVAGE